MASLTRHDIDCSRSRSGNRRSSQDRRRPRDSLEKMRRRRNSVAQTPCPALLSARNTPIQDSDDDDADEVLLATSRPRVNCRAACERYPKGEASVLMFMLNIIVMYVAGSAILNVFQTKRDSPLERHAFHFIRFLFKNCISKIFYPVTGLIADVYIGRWQMIHCSILLLLTGNVTQVVLFTLEGQKSIHLTRYVNKSIDGVAFLLLSVGSGAFEATSIPFGVDQLQGASSAEISSYFYFFYLSRNVGLGISVLVSCLLSYVTNKLNEIEGPPQQSELYIAFHPLVPTAALTVGLILIICCHHWFFKNKLWENPVKFIAKVLCYAATVKRHLPVCNRAFRYGEERKKRIELAKVTYDGKFPDEKVEDVKTFCRIFLILISLTPALFSINAFDDLLSQGASQTLKQLYPNLFLEENLYQNAYWVVNSVAVILVLPVVNFLVIPCMGCRLSQKDKRKRRMTLA